MKNTSKIKLTENLNPPDKGEIGGLIESYILRLVAKREYSAQMIQEKCHKKFLENKDKKSPHDTSPEAERSRSLAGDIEEVIKTIEKVIKTFQKNNYISDQRFTESLIRDQIRQKQGPLKITQKCYHYGIEKSLSEKLLEENYPPQIRQEIATEIFHKKKAEWLHKKKSDIEATHKSINYVQSRGFNYHDIKDL